MPKSVEMAATVPMRWKNIQGSGLTQFVPYGLLQLPIAPKSKKLTLMRRWAIVD